jgi:biotin transport system substrate-specific component
VTQPNSAAPTLSPQSLAAALWPAGQGAALRRARAVLLAVAGSLLIAVSAQVKVPMVPVPMTMQTFAVLLVGMAFGFRLGLATVLLYLAEGLAGLPVFTNPGASPAYLLGPTGGYLIGFAVAAALAGWLGDKGWDRSVWTATLAMTLGTACIFVLGVAWLATLIGLDRAIAAGFVPFVWGAAVKILLAALLLPVAWALISRFRG